MFGLLSQRNREPRKNRKRYFLLSRTLLFLEELEKREMLAASIDAFFVPTSDQQGQAVDMTAQASSSISGAALTYTWNFGDGNQ